MRKVLFVSIILIVLIIVVMFFLYFSFFGKRVESRPPPTEEKVLMEFLNKDLKNEFIPNSLQLKKKMFPEGEIGSDRIYGYNWVLDNTKFYTSLEYNEKNNYILNNIIEIFLDPGTIGKLDPDTASSFLRVYFKKSTSPKCGYINKTETTYCEGQLAENNDKLFLGAWKSKSFLTIFACEIPAKSEIYNWKSCSKPFKEEGIK